MAAQKSPLLGYNHNLKYKGRVYHVQTEDSGLDNPHIFTHLFHGSILNSLKQEYRDLVDQADWEARLRARMQSQHKDMMKSLIRGALDDRIVQFFGELEPEVEEQVPVATLPPAPDREQAPAQAPAEATGPPPVAPWDPSQAAQPPAGGAPAAQPPRPAQDSGVVVSMPMVIVSEETGGETVTATPARPPSQPARSAPHPAQPPTAQAHPAQAHPAQAHPAQPPADQPPPGGVPQEAAPADSGDSSVFKPGESKHVPESIFGSELISEKSLDEVILAYLSEDMSDD
jgi:hypothetical protein